MATKQPSKIGSALLLMGVGAGLMYLLDPQTGTRRRALLRDKMVGMRHDAERILDGRSEDVRNRAQGMIAETRKRFTPDTADDMVIASRVKSELGRHVLSNPGAVEVSVAEGTVTLHGNVLAQEVQQIVRAAKGVRGVKQVDNRLRVHDMPGNVPDVQTDLGSATNAARSGVVEKKGPANK